MEDKGLIELQQKIIENGYEDIILFSNPSYSSAFVGISDKNQAIYDYDKMIDFFMRN